MLEHSEGDAIGSRPTYIPTNSRSLSNLGQSSPLADGFLDPHEDAKLQAQDFWHSRDRNAEC